MHSFSQALDESEAGPANEVPSSTNLIYQLGRTRSAARAAVSVCLAFAVVCECAGQASEAPLPAGRIVVDGEPSRRLAASEGDSLRSVAAAIVDSLRGAGHYYARIDSVAGSDGEIAVHVSRGPVLRIESVHVLDVDDATRDRLLELMDTRPGRVLHGDLLESDVERILAHYERQGRPLAEVTVEELSLAGDEGSGLELVLRVAEGPEVPLKRIELPGAGRTAPSFVANLAGLQLDRPLTDYDAERLRARLEEAGFFANVGAPELVIDSDSAAVLRIPIDEGDPGTFDLVLGYLPPANPGERGSIVGNGHLTLRNLFGHGRMLALRLNRLPRQVSSIDVEASDPFVLGLPVGMEGGFHGLEQDSTYGKQSYRGEMQYRAAAGLEITAGFDREITAPGQAGLRLRESGRQVVPRAEAWFLGMGVRVNRLDRPENPTRGMFVRMNLETGRKQRSERRIVEDDTTSRKTLLRQRRLQASARFYVPTFTRQVFVAGGDGALLLSTEYDRSDLFRVGGASTLRGYDEDRFLGRAVGRLLTEYRFLIDRLSYAYAFFDLGYVDRPRTPDLEPAASFYPGYGLGIQFRTAVGLVNVSAAINPDDGPTDARIHAGLSFGI